MLIKPYHILKALLSGPHTEVWEGCAQQFLAKRLLTGGWLRAEMMVMPISACNPLCISQGDHGLRGWQKLLLPSGFSQQGQSCHHLPLAVAEFSESVCKTGKSWGKRGGRDSCLGLGSSVDFLQGNHPLCINFFFVGNGLIKSPQV